MHMYSVHNIQIDSHVHGNIGSIPPLAVICCYRDCLRTRMRTPCMQRVNHLGAYLVSVNMHMYVGVAKNT